MKKIVYVLLLFAFCITPLLQADHGESKGSQCGYSKGKRGLDDKLFYKAHFLLKNQDELGLSEEQVDALRNLKHETKKSVIMQNAEIEVIKVDAKHLLYQFPVDVEAINKLIDQKYEIKKAKAKGLVAAFAKLKEIVGEDGWAEMKELKKGSKK